MQQRLPNFFIIGAPKCGTTALYGYLEQHPEVYFPPNKEPQFFSNESLYARGLDYYVDTFFDHAEGHALRGDATPHYLYYSKAADRIARDLPPEHHRFIVILRDPVARAWSHYWNMVREGIEELEFAEALRQEPARIRDEDFAARGALDAHYVAAGLYAAQLEQWLRVFSRDRFLIVLHEHLVADRNAVMARVFRFLNLEPVAVASRDFNPSGRSRSVRLQRWMRRPNRLRATVAGLLPYRARYRLSRMILNANRETAAYPPLEADIAGALRERFAGDIDHLETLTGEDLSAWRAGAVSD